MLIMDLDDFLFILQFFSHFFSTFPRNSAGLRVITVCRGTPVENRCFIPYIFEIFAGVVRSFCLIVTKILLLE
jgi:hypothetical protein